MSIDLNPQRPRLSDFEAQAALRQARARKLAAQEAERATKRFAEDERERLTMVLVELLPTARAAYRRLGGRGVLPNLQWAPLPDPNEDPFEGVS